MSGEDKKTKEQNGSPPEEKQDDGVPVLAPHVEDLIRKALNTPPEPRKKKPS